VHDPDYRAALQDFTTFTGKLSEKVIEVDELIPELPVKDVVSTTHTDASTVLTSDRSIVSTGVYSSQCSIRSNMLNRVDIRFSKDPTPYKTYFSAAWSRTGRKGPYAHYYVQIQHGGGSFVGELMQSFLDSHIYLFLLHVLDAASDDSSNDLPIQRGVPCVYQPAQISAFVRGHA
jgi:hypothetical protein